MLVQTANEKIRYTADFSDQLALGETVSSVLSAVTTPTNLVTASAVSGQTATADVAAATNGTKYKLTIAVLTSSSNRYEKQEWLMCQEEILKNWQKKSVEIEPIVTDIRYWILPGDTISTVTVKVYDTSNNNTDVTDTIIRGTPATWANEAGVISGCQFYAQAGTNGVNYKVVVKFTMTSTLIYEVVGILTIKDL